MYASTVNDNIVDMDILIMCSCLRLKKGKNIIAVPIDMRYNIYSIIFKVTMVVMEWIPNSGGPPGGPEFGKDIREHPH